MDSKVIDVHRISAKAYSKLVYMFPLYYSNFDVSTSYISSV